MNDLDLDLRAAARDYDVPAGDVDAVLDRARRRSRRQRTVLAGTSVIAVLGATFAVLGLGDDDERPVSALGSPSGQVGDAGIAWSTAEPASALAMVRTDPAVSVGGRLYALSTAPGEADPNATQPAPLRLWSSSDGVDWQPGAEPRSDLYLSDLAARDDRIYAIGTGQATAAVVDGRPVPSVNIGWAGADGSDFTSTSLDIDYAAIAEHATSVNVMQRSVAAGPAGVVALVGVSAELDLPEVVPAGDPEPQQWAITDTGVDVLGTELREGTCRDGDPMKPSPGSEPEGPHRVWPIYCGGRDGDSRMVTPQDAYGVERSYTWDELGVDGDLRRAVLGLPFAFVGDEDGTSFERLALPEVPGVVSWSTLEGGGDGFDVLLSTLDPDPGVVYLHSADGRTWTEGMPPVDLMWATAAGTLGGRSVLSGSDEQNRPVVALRQADGGWQTIRPDSFLDPAVTEGKAVYSVGTGVGPLGIAEVLLVSDETRNDFEQFLLFSRDGSTWEVRSLDELVGSPVNGIGRVVVTADRVVVMVSPEQDRAEGEHLRQVAVVGTPS